MFGKLTVLKIKGLSKQGRYSDGDGLYLVISKGGSRSWVLRIQAARRRRDFGLGSASFITLAEARKRALETRDAILAGREPQASWRPLTSLTESPMTFRMAADAYHQQRKEFWKNAKHREQWINTLRTFAFPILGQLPVEAIDAPAVIRTLMPIWHSKPETARRVKQRICTVLDWANANEYRQQEAPASAVMRGLGGQRATRTHFAAMPYEHLPIFMRQLAMKKSAGSDALMFLILTAARSGEVRGATWNEIDLSAATWTVPADRMKAGKRHIVPLSAPVLSLLERIADARLGGADEILFPGLGQRPLSDATLSKQLRSLYSGEATVHGFRSSFRDWVAETQRTVSDAVAEAALAHTNSNRVEAAYRRTDYLDQRRQLMLIWGSFLTSTTVSQQTDAVARNEKENSAALDSSAAPRKVG